MPVTSLATLVLTALPCPQSSRTVEDHARLAVVGWLAAAAPRGVELEVEEMKHRHVAQNAITAPERSLGLGMSLVQLLLVDVFVNNLNRTLL